MPTKQILKNESFAYLTHDFFKACLTSWRPGGYEHRNGVAVKRVKNNAISVTNSYFLKTSCKKRSLKLHEKKKSYNFASQFRKEPTKKERCRSGRTGRSRKPLYPCGYPGFESLSLRNKGCKSKTCSLYFILRLICRKTCTAYGYTPPPAKNVSSRNYTLLHWCKLSPGAPKIKNRTLLHFFSTNACKFKKIAYLCSAFWKWCP